MARPARATPGIRRVLLAAGAAPAILLLAACAADRVEDRRPGQQLVCHGGKTLAVSNADSFVHLGHGDSAGPCPDEDG